MIADKNARHGEVKAGGLGLACGGLTEPSWVVERLLI